MNDTEIKENYHTTVVLRGDAYSLVRKKQTEIFDKIGEKISIQDLVYDSTILGLDIINIKKYKNEEKK